MVTAQTGRNQNTGDTAVDISGWYLYDNDPVGHASDINPVAEERS